VRRLRKQAAELGILGTQVPEAYGGAGLGCLAWVVVREALGWTSQALRLVVTPGPVMMLLAGSEAQRQEMLTQAIAQFGMVLAEAKESKAVQRHMQFKIASLQAQRAGNDRDQAKQAAAALEKFLQDHADSWQSHFARKLLAELKKP